MVYDYSAPERLERDWEEGRETPPDEMLEELSDDVEALAGLVRAGTPLVPVQGRVSDYKSWLAAATSLRLAEDHGMEVTAFAPQRTNRESAVTKLRMFGAELIEHPGRIDLCIWEPWRENVGHVDKSTCESIGCPFYLHSEESVDERAGEAVSSHAMMNGGHIDLYAGDNDDEEDWPGPGDGDMKRLGEMQEMCPAQLYLSARDLPVTDGAVNVATYAKAFADAAIADDDPLESDVVLLDEAHTVAADPDAVTETVDPDELIGQIEEVAMHLDGSAERWAQRAHGEVEQLRQSVSQWAEESAGRRVEPNEIFAGRTADLGDAFDTLDTVSERVLQTVRRRVQLGDWDAVAEADRPHECSEAVREFLSMIKQYRDGDLDFIHSLYEEAGETVNQMAFRKRADEPGGGTTPAAVYREWEESGTHPAIKRRWGPILNRYIESLWDGRALFPGGDGPGAPMMPLERLQEIAGADSVVTLSATHNELSDPTRPPGQLRPTRHRLLCAPVHLRADGGSRKDYSGSASVDPETPWFRSLVERAKEESGDSLAAVPINYGNAAKWEQMPVETIENDDGDDVPGIVPNSRGAIGEKRLEQMNIDTVACGIQVQSPAPTARRLVRWWEMLAPRREDPADVLSASWRLLAQHAVAGTIQAGGRFDWDATNLVFERRDLVELAGFEAEDATPDSPGFAGAFCRMFEEVDGEWTGGRDAVRAAKTVAYLEDADRKKPTAAQCVGEYARVYGVADEEARGALRTANERGRIGTRDTDSGAVFTTQ